MAPAGGRAVAAFVDLPYRLHRSLPGWMPDALLLSLATVYCQLHYGVDAPAGAALAAAVLWWLARAAV